MKERIQLHVKSLNEGNKTALQSIYSVDYEGIFPVSKFESKEDLVSQLIVNQQNQSLKIEFEIIEIVPQKGMAYAILDWKAVTNFGKPDQDELYHKKHLEIWIKTKGDWQLSRSLFYN